MRRDDDVRTHEALIAVTWMTHTLGRAPDRQRGLATPQADAKAEMLINFLSRHRNAARRRHAIDRADLVREGLAELGVGLVDTSEGTTWRYR